MSKIDCSKVVVKRAELKGDGAFAKYDIKKGEKFTKDNLGFYRIQGNKNSLEPKYFESILGRRAKKKIFSQTPLKNKHFK